MKRTLLAATVSSALPLLVVLAAACGGVEKAGGDDAAGSGTPPASASDAGSAPAAQPAPAPGLAPPDPLAEVEDSIHEADLFHRRQSSMESYESCMEKAKVLEPPARAAIEAACKRSRGAPQP